MGYSAQSIGVTGTWVPTFTGFSADPTSVVARYTLNGKWCTVHLNATVGTSNATSMTVTLPFAAKSAGRMACNTLNASVQANGLVATTAGSNVLLCYATVAGGAFTASGGKFAYLTGFTYEIE